MNIYDSKTIGERIAGNPYVGRGIVTGLPKTAGMPLSPTLLWAEAPTAATVFSP